MGKVRIWIAGALLMSGTAARAEPFTNDSVMALSRAGIGSGVLLAKVNSLPCGYDVSTGALIALKKAGVPDAVIAAMVDRCTGSARAQGVDESSDDPLAKRTPGLYVSLMEGGRPVLRVIRPMVVGGMHVTGNGSVVFPFIARLDVPKAAAQTIVPSPRPTFYFYFEAADRRVGDFGSPVTADAQSPAEFSLVRFKSTNGMREMTVGKVKAFAAQTGIDPKNTIGFSQTEIGDGIFRAEVDAPLASGQYAFVLRSVKGNYRIYDFQVN